jgi:hypothetical protein
MMKITLMCLAVLGASVAQATPDLPTLVTACKPNKGGCCDFSGTWLNLPHTGQYNFTQATGSCTVNTKACVGADVSTAVGDTLTSCDKFYHGMKGVLTPGTPNDELKWANGVKWFRHSNQSHH